MSHKNPEAIGIIFDLDGTLLDDIHLIKEIPHYLGNLYQKTLTETQLQELKDEIFEDLSGTGSKWIVVKSLLVLAKKMGIPWYLRMQFLNRANKFYLNRIKDCPVFPGATELIQHITEEYGPVGIYTTSSSKEIGERFQGRTDFLKPFKNSIITRDKVKITKPNPEGIEILSNLWGIHPTKIVMIGDMKSDIETGKAVDSLTVGVLTGFASRTDFEQTEADFIIEKFEDLRKILPKIRELIKNRSH